ncbi:hypothetical protein ABBQ38_005427 [Trebouxia sp. C0009 RCD-2024]
MGSVTRRQLSRRKSSGSSCGTSKLAVSKMPTKSAGHVPRWSALPEGPLLRMFEVMAWQDDGRTLLREAKLVCRSWRAAARETVLGDTATSRPCRPPMQATSDQAKPAATMNTCGAMMVGSNQSKDPCNDEVEVCSKPTQQRGSSSGNMCNRPEESEEAEQAGSVEQPSAPASRPAKRRSHTNKLSAPQRGRRRMFSAPCAQIGAGRSLQATRRITRASAAAAALAASEAPPQLLVEQASGAMAAASQPAASKSEGADPQSSAEEPSGSFIARPVERASPAAETSGEVQGRLQSHRDDDCESAPDDANPGQQTPQDQHPVQQESAEMVSQTAPSWRRLEARMEGVLPIWSIFKRFGRRPQHDQ